MVGISSAPIRLVPKIIAVHLACLILSGPFIPLTVKVFLYFSAIIYTLYVFYLVVTRRAGAAVPRSALVLPVAAFFLAVEASVLVSTDFYQSQKIFFSRYLGYFWAFFLGCVAAKDPKGKAVMIWALALNALAISIGALWDHFQFSSLRLFTAFGRDVNLATMLGLYIPFFFSLALVAGPKKVRYLCWVLLIPLNLSLLWHASRAAWVGIGVALFFIALMTQRKIIPWLIAILCLVYLASPLHLRYRMHRIFDAGTKVAMSRTAFEIFEDFPVTGGGLATFENLRDIYDPHARTDYLHTDNVYTELMAETGLMGLMTFIWIFYAFFADRLRLILQQLARRRLDPLVLGLSAAVAAVLIISLGTNTMTVGFQNAVIFWILLGFAAGIEPAPSEGPVGEA